MTLSRDVALTEHEEFVIVESLRCAARKYIELAANLRRDCGETNPVIVRIAEQLEHQAEQAGKVAAKLEAL
jgi:hypothetical protein